MASSCRGSSSPSPPPWLATTWPRCRISRGNPGTDRYPLRRVRFQIQFGGDRITTPGDARMCSSPSTRRAGGESDAPARGATIIVDENAFTDQRLKRADLASNPLEDGTWTRSTSSGADQRLTQAAVKPLGLGTKDSLRCKNFWALGLMLWLFDQPRDPPAVDQQQVRGERAGARCQPGGPERRSCLRRNHGTRPSRAQHPTPEAPWHRGVPDLTGAEALALGWSRPASWPTRS